jgi:hypothetical protein
MTCSLRKSSAALTRDAGLSLDPACHAVGSNAFGESSITEAAELRYGDPMGDRKPVASPAFKSCRRIVSHHRGSRIPQPSFTVFRKHNIKSAFIVYACIVHVDG